MDCSGLKLYAKGTTYWKGDTIVANSQKYTCNSTCLYAPPGADWDVIGTCKSGSAPH